MPVAEHKQVTGSMGGDGGGEGVWAGLRPGQQILGCKVVRMLGRGGMGVVYEVVRLRDGRKLALKQLSGVDRADKKAIQRFQRETRALLTIKHENIVRAVGAGVDDNRNPCLLMELCEGIVIRSLRGNKRVKTLEELVLARGGKLSRNELTVVIEDVLSGLACAHRNKMVHRDVKPSNILLFPGGKGRPFRACLCDFGLVRLLSNAGSWETMQPELTRVHPGEVGGRVPLLGTFSYMSPEQKQGQAADERSDVYAVGLMAYRLGTGEELGLSRASEVNPALHPLWDPWIERALAHDPSKRFQSALAMWIKFREMKGLMREVGNKRKKRLIQGLRTFSLAGAALLVGTWLWSTGFPGELAPHPNSPAQEPFQAEPTFANLDRLLPPDLVKVEGASPAPLEGLAAGSREAQVRQVAEAAREGLPLEVRTANVGMLFRYVPSGEFLMGSPRSEQDAMASAGARRDWVNSEGPSTRVGIREGMYVGKYPVTQGEWERVMGSKPSHFQNAGPNAPVESVSWHDAQEFVRRMCELEGVPPGTYRLLSKMEWEYACRAGTTTALYTGGITIRGRNHAPELDAIAWYSGNSGVSYEGGFDSSRWEEKQNNHRRAGTHPVGQKLGNAYGLHDMIGNVWEWTNSDFAPYTGNAMENDPSPGSGSRRVSRGGAWNSFAFYCRAAFRCVDSLDQRERSLGLRIMRIAPPSVDSLNPEL